MDLERRISELDRQAANSGGSLSVKVDSSGIVDISGSVRLDALIQVVLGTLAGGP